MKTRAFFLLFLFLVLFLGGAGLARANQVDDFINEQMKKQKIPGLSLAVLRNGEVIKAKGYGFSDTRLKTPATTETVYKIASVSKQFIATGILLLVQEGRIALDDRIARYLEDTPASWKDITIRHLLTHTSGIQREAPGFDLYKPQPDADVIRSAYALPLRFVPGEKYEYSNTPYFALAEIIRRVSGQPWTEYLDARVFKPSGMNSTFPTNTTVRVPNLAAGYVDNDKLQDAPHFTALRPSGAFLSTIMDLARWDAMLYTDRILKESTRQEMWTAVKLNDGSSAPYGFGWQLAAYKNSRVVHHGGGLPGFAAEFARYLDDSLTVIVLMNLDDVDPIGIVNGVADLYRSAPGDNR